MLVIGVFLCVHEWWTAPNGRTTVVRFFDVAQGDSAFITGPHGQQVLIDGGPDLSALEQLGHAMPFFDRTIDILILTHPHLDHVAGFPEILRRYHVGRVIITAAAYENGRYEEFLHLVGAQKIPIVIADPNRDLDLGDGLTLDILWPPPMYFGKTIKRIHDSCIVFKLVFGKNSILFTGDAEESVEEELLSEHIDLHADILKVGHHGSKTSSSSGFLLAVNPALSIISVGAQNSYGLPSPVILNRFHHFSLPFRTTMSGAITVRMEGEEWGVKQ